ncbi:DUF947-domain-containing protein [Peniophora sp. CONT]|nr:DUF947-domain-containing protein [Peniophora sp. CONT]
MPRRPRSTSKQPRPSSDAQTAPGLRSKPTAARKFAGVRSESGSNLDSDSEEEVDDRGEGPSSLGSASEDEEGDESDDAVDPDAPRIAQWQDEDELEEDEAEEAQEDNEDTLQNDLRSLPFGALRKAQRALAQATADSDTDDSDAGSGSDREEPRVENSKGKQKDEPKPKKRVAKRSSKHAPQETTAKRPVSWHRQVVDVHKVEPRDPRFLSAAGSFDPTKFRSQYDFLSNLHKDELSTLRENLKRARKLVVSSPRDQRTEREAEVERLERAVKRAESAVNRDKRERVEQEAIASATREEKEKRKHGKGAFYLKDADKKKLLLKARYEAMAAEGGKRAVKKAIEKKQKKISQKETKSRPFARGSVGGPSTGSKRSGEPREQDNGWPKRRKVG